MNSRRQSTCPQMNNAAECGVQVFCRIRPMNKKEEGQGEKFLPKFPQGSDDQISLAGKTFHFDRVFKPNSTQEQVYQGAAYHIVQDVLNGFNGTIMAYGQTSSGKTHTMEGDFWNAEQMGVIPRIVDDIFQHMNQMDSNLEFQLRVSYFEIYNENIRDLLDVTKTNLAIHEDKNRVPYVKNATEMAVCSPDEIMSAIETGKANRAVASTNMNMHSSRSHSVFLISVQQTDMETKKQLIGKLYLVDLAGSEKCSKTGAKDVLLEEAKNINKSLTTLGRVISTLSEGKRSHVPYRDSKLTRVLQQSLGGNSRTTVILCASPARYNEDETRSTLQFGARARTIKNVVAVNEELSPDEWKLRCEKEKEKVSALYASVAAAMSELEKWRKGEKVPEWEWVKDTPKRVSPTPSIESSWSSWSRMSSDRSVTPLSSRSGSMPDVERERKLESEIAKLHQQLDDKDDEIQTVSQKLEQHKQQLTSTDVQLAFLRNELHLSKETNISLEQELQRHVAGLNEARTELEKVSVKCEEKERVLCDKNNEIITLLKEMRTLAAQSQVAAQKESSEQVDELIRKVQDLETELDQSRMAREQLLKHNTLLGKMLDNKKKQIRTLQEEFRGTVEKAKNDRQRFEGEMETLKKMVDVRCAMMTSPRPGPQIVKPIRGGHVFTSPLNPGFMSPFNKE